MEEELNEVRANDMTKQGGKFVLDFRKFPLVLKKILSNLPTSDLLTCSLVCKAWNYESRCVLRESRTLVAIIEGKGSPCWKLKEFDAFLSNLSIVPYSGLNIRVSQVYGYPAHCLGCLGSQNLEELYPLILNMNLKYLQIDWKTLPGSSEDREPPCAVISLLQRFLRRGQMEHFYIKNLPTWLNLYDAAVNENLELSNLKSLRIGKDGYRERGLRRRGMDVRIVDTGPDLERLYGTIFTRDTRLLPSDKLKCITRLCFLRESHADLDFLEQIALAGPKLEKLSVPLSPAMNLDRVWRILGLLLESSKDSLGYLKTNLAVALKLNMILQVPLNGLEKLDIVLHNDRTHMSLLGHIDLARLFPGLKSLMVDPNRSFPSNLPALFFTDEELPQGEHIVHNYTAGLILRDFCVEQFLPTVAATFPNIRSFDGNPGWRRVTPYTLLWELWPSLERLVVMEFGYFGTGDSRCLTPFLNLDAEFCGISPEEAAELQTTDEEFLQKVHIVPIKPAITDLRNLQKFRLRIHKEAKWRPCRDANNNDLFLLSKVTGCVAFKRMPRSVDMGIEVGLARFIYDLKHMRPYINVVERDMDNW